MNKEPLLGFQLGYGPALRNYVTIPCTDYGASIRS